MQTTLTRSCNVQPPYRGWLHFARRRSCNVQAIVQPSCNLLCTIEARPPNRSRSLLKPLPETGERETPINFCE